MSEIGSSDKACRYSVISYRCHAVRYHFDQPGIAGPTKGGPRTDCSHLVRPILKKLCTSDTASQFLDLCGDTVEDHKQFDQDLQLVRNVVYYLRAVGAIVPQMSQVLG